MRYRKKPVIVDAFQVPLAGEDKSPFRKWCKSVGFVDTSRHDGDLSIRTLDGEMWARPGYYIIKDVDGEFSPCRPDVFAETYLPIDPEVDL